MSAISDFFNSFRPIYATAGITLLIIVLLAVIDPAVSVKMIKDDGLVQIITACLLCSAVVLAIVRAAMKTSPVLSWVEASYIIAVYCMREMDFHRLFTDEHVTRLKLYTGPYPLEQKLIGGVIMVLFIIVALHFVKVHFLTFLQALKNKLPRAWFLATWGILLLGAQIIDKPRFFKGALKAFTEESMELGASLMIVFILLSFFFSKSKDQRSSNYRIS